MTDYKATVYTVSGQSVVVIWHDPQAEVNPSAHIVDAASLGGVKPGQTVYIPGDVLAKGTPYGLDWSVFFPDGFTVTPQAIHSVMYNHGIVTMKDLKNRASDIPTILAHLYAELGIQLYNKVKQEVSA